MKDTAIEWTDHTFNPWYGCARVSPGCMNCYAETLMADRYKKVEWGPGRARVRTSKAYWNGPSKWDREAAAAGVRACVFCASLADVFDPEVSDEWRGDLYRLIRSTPNLDWLLLTKRPEHAAAWVASAGGHYPNVWIGVSVEDQQRADERIPILLTIPAVVRFLSVEPMLGPVDLRQWTLAEHGRRFIGAKPGIDWVICGGESGKGARRMDPAWAESVRDQCVAAGVPFFFKQWGGVNKKVAGRILDDRTWDEIPKPAGGQTMTDRINLDDLERLHREADDVASVMTNSLDHDCGVVVAHKHVGPFSSAMHVRCPACQKLAAAYNALPHLLAVARAALDCERYDLFRDSPEVGGPTDQLHAALAPFRAGEEKGKAR